MLSFLSQNIFFPTKQTIHIARSCILVLSLKNMDWINGLWDGWKTVWKWISCTKSNWKPSPSGGPQGLILEPVLLSIFGRTDPQQATAGCGEVGDNAHSGCLSEALKRLEKWAAENQWISKASANFCIWKRTAPRSSTGRDWLARKQLCREKAQPEESWLATSGRCYQPMPLQQRQPTACWAILAIL